MRSLREGLGLAATTAALALLTCAAGLLWWSLAPVLVGWHPLLVLTGSMGHSAPPGSVVLVSPLNGQQVQPGGIVQVRDRQLTSGSYLHRAVRYDDAGLLVTKGDANPGEDLPHVAAGQVLGRARLVVPLVGLPALWARQGAWLPLAGCLAAVFGALVVLLRRQDRPDPDG